MRLYPISHSFRLIEEESAVDREDLTVKSSSKFPSHILLGTNRIDEERLMKQKSKEPRILHRLQLVHTLLGHGPLDANQTGFRTVPVSGGEGRGFSTTVWTNLMVLLMCLRRHPIKLERYRED